MTSKNITYGSAALLVVGLFMPIVTLPIVGGVNLFGNGTNEVAVMLLVLTVAGAILAVSNREKDLIYPAIAASGLLIYTFGRLEYVLLRLREGVSEGLKGNPFAGLAQAAAGAVQLQWGWLVLAAGAGGLVYASLQAKPAEREGSLFLPRDPSARVIAALSLVLLLVAPASDAISAINSASVVPGPNSAAASAGSISESSQQTQSGPGKAEIAYINSSLQIYDLSAKYYDSEFDGRIPGIDFKLRNNGNKTLSEVDVKVVFYDKDGKSISEDTYYPVLDSSFDASENKPLRPNYIWQQTAGKFYEAKDVPSEWDAGRVTASITDIKFAPNE